MNWDFWETLPLATPRDLRFFANDPDGIRVYLSREQWVTHILDRHGDMQQHRYLMFQAVSCPSIRRMGFPTEKGFAVKHTYCYSHQSEKKAETVYLLEVVIKYLAVVELGSRLAGLISTAHILPKERVQS